MTKQENDIIFEIMIKNDIKKLSLETIKNGFFKKEINHMILNYDKH